MQTYASDVLYHMVGGKAPMDHERNFDTLCKILESREIRHRKIDGLPGPMSLKIDFDAAMADGELIVQTVICFCDIHLSQLAPIHTGKYGRFGVGVDRHLVASWGGRPVSYIPMTKRESTCYWNHFGSEVMTAYRALHHYFEEPWEGERTSTRMGGGFPKSPDEALDMVSSLISKELLAYLKFFNSDLPVEHPQNYYMEREWRKFGNLPLDMALRQVIVASGYGNRLGNLFPQLTEAIVEI